MEDKKQTIKKDDIKENDSKAKSEEEKEVKNDVVEEKEEKLTEKEAKEQQEKEEKAESEAFFEDDDDLPEDIKKKLEKKKSEDKSKSGKKGKKRIKRKKKKERGRTEIGKVYIHASFNNTIVTITDLNGEVISWSSAGVAGFRGPKKSTPYAAQIITKIATIKAKEEFGFKQASVFVKGVGMGKEAVIRTLNAQGIYITSIKDVTPIPHNGCRRRKPRRV